VFVYTDNPQIKPGAWVKLTLQNTLSVEAQPTPTVEMEVKRVETDGLALAFINVTGRHLWQSVEQLRTELAIGRDFFQVHLNAVVIYDTSAVLLAQQHGKWMLPATFLRVGDDWREALSSFLRSEFAVEVGEFGQIVTINSMGHAEVPEAAVLDIFVEAHTRQRECRLASGSRYKTIRWTDRRRDVEEATFATEQIRTLVDAVLKRLVKEEPRR
jgi:ADP-ribose pyrophosphatase YjhB (NUDIX family)